MIVLKKVGLPRPERERVSMKVSLEIPVTAWKPGKGLLPDRQRLVRDVVIRYQERVLDDRQPGVEKSHALENPRLAARLPAPPGVRKTDVCSYCTVIPRMCQVERPPREPGLSFLGYPFRLWLFEPLPSTL